MTAVPPYLTSPLLDLPEITHGFFSRDGGVSKPPYDSLNTGPGSGDEPEMVQENRDRCALALGVLPGHLATGYQTHSPDVKIIDAPWPSGAEKVDALVTRTPGLAVGALAADCMPFLFVAPCAGIVAAAHAGWRGALFGVLENTVETMARLGADRGDIRASVGPCLRQQNFEVGLDLLETFTAKYAESEQFFSPGLSDDKRQLDLVGFGQWRLLQAGVTQFDDINLCTLDHPNRFFSYRHTRRKNLADYGRNLSAIALKSR